MLNKAYHKTRCKCMRKEEEEEGSLHGDYPNVLAQKFKPFAIKRFGEQVSFLIISVNELKSESTIFNKLLNEVVSNLYMFCSRMLNMILRDVNDTGIVTIDGRMFLTNTIMRSFCIHKSQVQQLLVAMYSALVVDNEMKFCFLLIQETKLVPT